MMEGLDVNDEKFYKIGNAALTKLSIRFWDALYGFEIPTSDTSEDITVHIKAHLGLPNTFKVMTLFII
jgi:DnaJ-class molecular chaperone